jgi:pimeloyl-ACP methyl ester carboxylesterase
MTGTTTTADTTQQLYWEAAGAGRPVLLIPGTPGDGAQFDALAGALSRDHLVITYDRRGTSRSGAPEGWSTTSAAEQAGDALDVLSAVGVANAVVFGTSNGAAVALELALAHPARVAGLMLHEPPLVSVLADPEPVMSATGALIGAAMETGGPRAALDAFLRFAYGDRVVEAWPAELHDRMLANAEMVFTIEMPAFQGYRPAPEPLAACRVPACLLVGEQQPLPFFREAADWVAGHLGAEVASAPGAHGAHFSHPEGMAAQIRSFAATV